MRWNPPLETKASPYSAAGFRRSATYRGNWDIDRAEKEALLRVTWVYRCVDAIASNAAGLPFVFRRGDSNDGEEIGTHPLISILNSRSNTGEDSVAFRYRLSAQLLLSQRGVFVEVLRTRGGDVAGLRLFPPQYVEPVPHSELFVSGYEIRIPGEKMVTLKPEQVVWLRKPHPFDPYAALTPLEAAGLSIETDWFARLYNRNFLLNDGRPGGMVVLKGEISEEDKAELRRRYAGNLMNAGRISVIGSGEGADFVDTAVTPRDAQYTQTRKDTRDEILLAFGVPESVLGNAAGRTFDNAEQERLIFWMETMRPHLQLVSRPLDVLDEDPQVFASFDTSRVDVIQRFEIKRREFLLRELEGGAISPDEYRIETTRPPFVERGNRIYIPKTKVWVATTDGEEVEDPEPEGPGRIGRPPASSDPFDPEDPDAEPTRAQEAKAPELTLRVVTGTEEKVERLGPWSLKSDESLQWRGSVADNVEMWETVYSEALKRHYERQKRVVLEKILGSKVRKQLEQGTLRLAQVFSREKWDEQLREDFLPIFRGVTKEVGVAVAEKLDGTFDLEDPAILRIVEEKLEETSALHLSISSALEEILSAGGSGDQVKAQVEAVYGQHIESAGQVTLSKILPLLNMVKTIESEKYRRGPLVTARIPIEDLGGRQVVALGSPEGLVV